jgi:ElaB/YqjD/DUF883 family membrane-anchored ribosome-binding protein
MTNRVKDAAERAGTYASAKLQETRETVKETAEAARMGARSASKRAVDTIGENPLAAVLGAAAVGALAGVLLPATSREETMLGPVGGRIGDAAKTALSAAREAGRETLGNLGVNEDAARTQFDRLIDIAVKAVSSAGDAASKAVRK